MLATYFNLTDLATRRSHVRRLVAVGSLLLAMCAPVSAAQLLSDNVDGAMPGGSYTAGIPASALSAITGNVDIVGPITNGAASGFFTCPAGGAANNNCLDLNGTMPGAVQSNAKFNLIGGRPTRSASAPLAVSQTRPMIRTASRSRSETAAPRGSHAAYAMHARLGNGAPAYFSALPGSAFVTKSFTYTPISDEAAAPLQFVSDSTAGDLQYGALIDTVSVFALSSADPNAVPEPGSMALLLVGRPMRTADDPTLSAIRRPRRVSGAFVLRTGVLLALLAVGTYVSNRVLQPASLQGVVNAPMVTLRAPIDGKLIRGGVMIGGGL